MLVFGRASDRIVWPDANVAAALPLLATAMSHVKLPPSTVLPLWVLVAVRFGAVTVTVSPQVLSFSLLSEMTLPESAEQPPAVAGFTKSPMAVGVPLNSAVNVPGAAMITVPPFAVQVSVKLLMLQPMVPVPVIPLGLTTLTDP